MLSEPDSFLKVWYQLVEFINCQETKESKRTEAKEHKR